INRAEFYMLIGENLLQKSSNTGLNEFSEILKHLKGKSPKQAVQDKKLLKNILPNGYKFNLISLSPSDNSILKFQGQLKDIIKKKDFLDISVGKIGPNHASVV